MIKPLDYVYIKSDIPTDVLSSFKENTGITNLIQEGIEKEWIYSVSSIEDDVAELEYRHPSKKGLKIKIPVSYLEKVFHPLIGDKVKIVSNKAKSYGIDKSFIGKKGIVKSYGSAHKSAVIKLESGEEIKVHFMDLKKNIQTQDEPKIHIEDISECSDILIKSKENVQKCIVEDIGNTYYTSGWDSSLVPRDALEKCHEMMEKSYEATKKCEKMLSGELKAKIKPKSDELDERIKNYRKEYSNLPRKMCNNNKVIKFKDNTEVAKMLTYSDAEACIDAGGTWDASTGKCSVEAKSYSLNMITNAIHNIGLDFVKVKTKHCKCKFASYGDINEFFQTYCEGVGKESTAKNKELHHSLGIHHAIIKITPTDSESADIKVYYKDSINYKGSKARMHAIKDLLEEKLNMQCKIISEAHTEIECTGKITHSDLINLKTLALTLSGTIDADLKTSDKKLMKKNMTKLWELSHNIAEKEGCQSPLYVGSYWEG